jgi:putative phage-type endonuclease
MDQNDFDDIYESLFEAIDEYVQSNLINMKHPNFHNELYQSLYNLFSIQFLACGHEFESNLKQVINFTLKHYFATIIPRRSYKNTFNTKPKNKNKIDEKLKKLSQTYQPPQRTEDWYKYRHRKINASSAGQLFSTPAALNRYIYEKCLPYNPSKYSSTNTETPMHWGVKYEPISVQLYEFMYETKLEEEFGCITHPVHTFLAASPDGINTCKTSPTYGRMLEIKNVVSREITGIPKEEYWIQMQLQMEVCNLNECDFLETKFIEYNSYNDFLHDGPIFERTFDNKLKGIILSYMDEHGYTKYIYPPFDCDKEAYFEWEKQIETESPELNFCKIYWKLEVISCVLVQRNKAWFNEAIKVMENVWNTILYECEHDCYHSRAPKKREPKKKPKGICNINIEKVSQFINSEN